MARNPETKGFVGWRDVMDVWNYYEQAFNVHIRLELAVRCPKGEQFYKLYGVFTVIDTLGGPVTLPRATRVQFPSSQYSTLPGALLAGLYHLDAALMEVRAFTEPTIARKPRVGLDPQV